MTLELLTERLIAAQVKQRAAVKRLRPGATRQDIREATAATMDVVACLERISDCLLFGRGGMVASLERIVERLLIDRGGVDKPPSKPDA